MDDETKSHAAKLTARTACTVTSLAAHRQRLEAREECLRELRRWAWAEWARQVRRQPSEMHWLRRLERGVR